MPQQPDAVPARNETLPLTEQLKTAEINLAEAEVKLSEVRERRLEALSGGEEYRKAKQTAVELEEKVKSMRAAKSPRLAETSKEWIAAKNRLTKLLHTRDEALLQDAECTLAASNVAKLKAIIGKLQDAIREEAALAAKAKQRKEESEGIVQSPETSSGSSSGGTVYVKGYYRKDGTYVRGYTRRK
jgi:alanyl-tRNA synthetase